MFRNHYRIWAHAHNQNGTVGFPDADILVCLDMFNRGNGYETWQRSLLYIFVGYFGSRACTKPGKLQKEIVC